MKSSVATQPEPQVEASTMCVFCAIVTGDAPARVVRRWDNVIAIHPQGGGVTDGHTLVIPHQHVADVGVDPLVSGLTMAAAAELAAELDNCNVITSRGRVATQSVFHLHVHVVPRVQEDGLLLPWSPVPSFHITVQPKASRWNVSMMLEHAAA